MFQTLIFKRDKKVQKSLLDRRDDFRIKWLNVPGHHWISSNLRILAAFEFVVDSLSHSTLDKFSAHKNEIIFLNTSGLYTLSVTAEAGVDYIVLFPETIELIASSSTAKAASIITHELGHILAGHSPARAKSIEGQMEADHFTSEVGLGNELQDLLLEFRPSEAITKRINHLTVLLTRSNL
ncbi:MAG: hypothetical protein KAG61_06590 [Bacteriovoracaceae bacterium]|nr:hypothetical protein [Bacteriovoracaceae bacterium]